MNSVIQIDSLSKRFGQTIALDEISLSIPPGVVFALLGENGAGKTTMIRILTGFESPDSGTAKILGHDCAKDSMEIRRQIGCVSDSPAIYDWMTAEEAGWFASAFYEEGFTMRYLELLVEFDLPTGLAIKKMSKGQRAKVSLALALAHDPKLLILDEPTSGLDPMVRRQFLESMVDRAATGQTVLLSSHQISEVERVADWVAIVHRGRLQVLAPLQQLREETTIVTVTLPHSDVAAPIPRGKVLTESKNGRQVRYVVSNLEEGWQTEFDGSESVASFQSQPATLEEVFVAVCDDSSKRFQPSAKQMPKVSTEALS